MATTSEASAGLVAEPVGAVVGIVVQGAEDAIEAGYLGLGDRDDRSLFQRCDVLFFGF